MTFGQFLDASFALWTEERMRLHPLQDWATLRESIAPVAVKAQPVPSKQQVKSQNEQSMAALQAILAQVPNSPTRKRPRKTR